MSESSIAGDRVVSKVHGQRRELAFGRGKPSQVIEVGEAMPAAHPEHGIAHWQKVGGQGPLGQFVAEWEKRRAEWLKKDAPAAVAPIGLLPQIIPKGGILEVLTQGPILSRLREIIGGK